MSIESISNLKGLGGSFPLSRGAPDAPSGQDGLLRDTARELEQLFDEFQSLRNSISTEPDLPSPPRAYVPERRSEGLRSPARTEPELQEPSSDHKSLLAELSLRDREINSMRQSQSDKDALLRAHDAKTARLESELKAARDQLREQHHKQHMMRNESTLREKQRGEQTKQHAHNLKIAREMELQKAHQLTKQTPILEVLSTLESDGAAKQRELEELHDEIKTLRKSVRQKDKVIEQITAEVNELKDRPDNVAELQNDVKMLLHTIEGLQNENRTLGRLDAEKSAVIQDLTEQVAELEKDDHRVAALQNEIQAANMQNKELINEVNTLQLAEQKRTKRILKESEQDGILTSKEWMDERVQLKSQLAKANEKFQEVERTSRAQEKKVNTLVNRMNTLSGVVKESKVRRMPSSLPEEPGQDVISEVGEYMNVGMEEAAMWVPAEMYTFLEAELRVLRADVEEKETMLLERDELVEGLERKVDVLTKARAAESTRGAREISKLTSELEETRASFVKHGTPRALQASQRSSIQSRDH